MAVWIDKAINTLIALLAFAIGIYAIRRIMEVKLKKLGGYHKLANIFYSIAFIVFGLSLLHISGVLPLLISFAAALGIVGVIFGFSIMTVWLSNAVAGVALIFDKLIEVGSRIKINGSEGRIMQISLTSTKLVTDEGKLLIIPNKSFRERPYLILKLPRGEEQRAGQRR